MGNNFFSQKRQYRLVEEDKAESGKVFYVQVRGILGWHIVKSFESDDDEYARCCATELLENLREDIE